MGPRRVGVYNVCPRQVPEGWVHAGHVHTGRARALRTREQRRRPTQAVSRPVPSPRGLATAEDCELRSCQDLRGPCRRSVQLPKPRRRSAPPPGPGQRSPPRPGPTGPAAAAHPCQDLVGGALHGPDPAQCASPALASSFGCWSPSGRRSPRSPGRRSRFRALAGPAACSPGAPRGPRRGRLRPPVRADCGHRFCRACVVRFWAEEDGPFPCPECADDCWQRAVEPGRPPLSRRLLALEEAAAAPARDGPASEAALQLLCRADAGPLCAACRMAAGPEPPEWEPRWRKALRGKVREAGSRAPQLTVPRASPPPPRSP
ncbi:hypothetical protein P7K49_035317 [Saguinus oedipus]|uniref:RING-type domain-containing protein n=1 Tax=Saguinus oedipus TaxID=9490 RepID=A0ABQ9TM91_SAGOE|nr:hypothetical protein P7K49_035317 [Saguinus oedipus]